MRPLQAIMIVEENALERQFIKDVIHQHYQRHALQIVEANDGTDALQKLRVFQPEFVVMTIEHTGMNSIDLQKKMLQIKPTVYTIWTSIYSNFDILNQGLLYNIRGYLLKPYTKNQIMVHLDKFIARKNTYALSENYNKNYSEHVNQAMAYIKKNYQKKLTIEEIAQHVYLNAQYFGRVFRKEVGISVSDYMNLLKVEASCRLLCETELPLYGIATKVGFADSSYFTRVFTKYLQLSPHEYRKQGQARA